MTNRYEEDNDFLAFLTKKIDRYGRVSGMTEYRGKSARVLVLARNPAMQPAEPRRVA